MRRLLKFIGITIAAIGGVLVLAAIGLWWWAGTQQSLDWTLARIAKSQTMTAEGVRGSLRDGLRAQHLRWEHEGLKIEAFDADFAWRPLAIARDTIKIDHLYAARLRIEDRRPPKPSVVPTSLTLPMRVEVDDLRIGRVQWITTTQDIAFNDLAGSYTFNGLSHNVKLESVTFLQGTYSGEASLGAGGPLPVDARLQGRFAAPLPAAAASAPLTFTATLKGRITEMEARAQLQGAPDSAVAGTRARATAQLRPWEAQPVPQAQAEFQHLDVGALWPQAPRTSLDGRLELKPQGTATWVVSVDATNATPGPWDKHQLPVEQVSANGEWHSGGATVVRELHARGAGGTVDASGELRGADAWTLEAKLAKIDPAAIHTSFAALPIGGAAEVKGNGSAIDFDVDLKSGGAPPKSAAAALELRSARAQGRWRDGTLSLPALDVRMADATVQAALELQPKAKAGRGRASVNAPGLQLRAEGRVAERSGAGQLDVRANDIAQAMNWIARWPGVPRDAAAAITGGRADAQLAWQGGWQDPTVQARVNAPLLTLKGTPPWTIRDASATLNGRLADAQLQLHARAEQEQRRAVVGVAGHAGRKGAVWQGQLASLDLSLADPSLGKDAWSLALQRAFDWRWSAGRFEAGAGSALLKSPRAGDAPAQIAWDPVRWGGGELHTSGRMNGLPLAWIELAGGPQLAGTAVSGDMVFDAQWEAHLGATPRIRASLARSRGDVTVLAENAEGRNVRVAAGVREARLALESNGEVVTATLRWDSEHGGTADGRLTTRLVRGGTAGWQWPDGAPLNGSLRARLPRIGVWSLLAPPGWRLRGSLVADVNVSGTKADPQLNGTLAAYDLALRSVVDGIEMQGGRLRARLEGRRMLLDEFILHGSGPHGGTLSAKGEGAWTPSGPQASMAAELTKLRASIRSDRQVTLSGHIDAKRDAGGTAVTGNLRIDQALIVLPDRSTPKLGDDVVVRNAAAPITTRDAKAVEDATKKPVDKLQVAVDIDLGSDFRVRGVGVDTRLRGTLALSGQSITQPRIVGTIATRGGEYQAYGQRLDIERGVIRFTGPVDNPALDVLAIRPNITQRVGVLVSGTALNPFVRLYSEPDLPDAEKLAWLVTGRAAPATGAESALVQQAALALLASRTGAGKQGGIAATLGLDELSFRREGSEGPSVTLGKRFGQHFYAAYERGLSGAVGTLYIFYDITRKLTVRAQAGERQALDLIYTLAFD
jgi:translocation and assembly module TamB